MNAETYARVSRVFAEVRSLAEPARSRRLDELAAGDDELRREVASLLRHDRPETIVAGDAVHGTTPVGLAPAPSEELRDALVQMGRTARRHRRTLVGLGLAILAVFSVGWLTKRALEQDLVSAQRERLQTIRDQAALHLDSWLTDAWRGLEQATERRDVPRAAARLGAVAAEGRADPEATVRELHRVASELGLERLLAPFMQGLEPNSADRARTSPENRVGLDRAHSGWALLSTDGVFLAMGGLALSEGELPERVGGRVADEALPVLAAVFRGERRFLPPRVFGGNAAARPADSPLFMALVEPVRGADDQVIAALAFSIDPAGRFTSVLDRARTGRTGETYAFDDQGRMLSASRFHADLVAAGLLAPGEPEALRVHVRDPGGSIYDPGFRPEGEAVDRQRTLAVRDCLAEKAAGEDGEGLDDAGYRDYRGVEVVGAWTWLEEYGLGIVSEIDAAEAKAPLRRLDRAFGVLIAGCGLAMLALLTSGLAVQRLREGITQVSRLGQYDILDRIGEGGMGVVFRGRHRLLKRDVAIKVIRDDRGDAQTIARFQREAEHTARLTHPNTVVVFDYGRTEAGSFYLVMEYLDGHTLRELVQHVGGLPPALVVHVLRQLLGSLAEAHDLGLVHRDVKPANLMLCDRGGRRDVLKVLDFGLVKELVGTDAEATLRPSGTPRYMAPERIRNGPVDGRADLFSVGATAYYLLTGREAFAGRTPTESCAAILNDTPAPPAQRSAHPLPRELEGLVLDCMAKDPAGRPADARAAVARLDALGLPPWTDDDARAFQERHRAQLEHGSLDPTVALDDSTSSDGTPSTSSDGG